MGFLSKLFSHKSVEEVADEIANTYAEVTTAGEYTDRRSERSPQAYHHIQGE